MKKYVLSLVAALMLACTAGSALAEESFHWDKAPNKTNDLAALQNGAKLFVNYCLSCHSAQFMRFNRLRDIGLTEQQIKDNLMFTTDTVGDVMKAAINPKEAKDWFGGNPPDLTLVARSRAGEGGSGADYLYTYLRTYYRDEARPTGWNNLAFPNVGMPNVLWELQGERKPVYESVEEHGHEVHVFKGWEVVKPGLQSPEQYDESVADLVNYLQWMAEPVHNTRVRLGVGVLLFLLVLTAVTWRLNAAFWKEVK